MIISSASHRGKVRRRNEDTALVREHERYVAVCDGMGGHKHGDIASAMTGAVIAELLVKTSDDDLNKRHSVIRNVIRTANDVVYTEGQRRGTQIGSTIVLAAFGSSNATIAHVGDSRAYILRGGDFFQLTVDHTGEELLVRQGMTRAMAAALPGSQALLGAIGADSFVSPTVATIRTQPGDRLLLCSDGLYRDVEPWRIASILRDSDPSHAAESLLAAALATRCGDNVTAITVAL